MYISLLSWLEQTYNTKKSTQCSLSSSLYFTHTQQTHTDTHLNVHLKGWQQTGENMKESGGTGAITQREGGRHRKKEARVCEYQLNSEQ